MIAIMKHVERYELCLKFDDEVGFVGAQVKLFLRRDADCKEMDYRALQLVLQNKGGFLSLWANGRTERVKVTPENYLYSLLMKIQGEILGAIQQYFIPSPRTVSDEFRLMGGTSHPDYPDIVL